MKVVGMLVTFMAMAGFALATTVPEIDTNSVGNGLALVAGALLIARGRKNR